MPIQSRRAVVLIACACAIFWPGAFIFGFPGVMRQYWQQTFATDGSGVGQTVFFVLIGATCFMYLCGKWQEKYGPGKLAALGAVLCGSSAVWLGSADNMTAVYIWAFSVGASSAFVYVPALTVVQRWYPENRGLVSGFFNMAFGLSAAVMSPIFTFLLSRWGYKTTNLVLGCIALIIGLAASLLIRFPESISQPAKAGASAETLSASVGEALKSREFWFLWLTWVMAGAAGSSMLVLATGFGLSRGLSLPQAVVLLTAFNLTNGSGRLISGYFSDRVGRSKTMAVAFVCAAIAYLLMPHLEGIWLWALLAAVIGYAFGTLFAVTAPLAGDCFGMVHFGAIFGLIFTAYGFLSGPLGPWLSGHILDITGGNYTLVFSYLGIMYLASAALILFVRPWRECQHLRPRERRQGLNRKRASQMTNRPLDPKYYRLPTANPLDWEQILAYLKLRAIPGVETVDAHCYRRSFEWGHTGGCFTVTPGPGMDYLRLKVECLTPVYLKGITRRVGRIFDLDAPVTAIRRRPGKDPLLADILEHLPWTTRSRCLGWI